MKEFFEKTIRIIGIAVLLALLTTSGYCSESWGAGLFKVKRHDFGRVALGADAEYRFVFDNNFVQDIRIIDVQSSCSCTAASFPKSVIKSAEKGIIVAKLNTTGQHLREKSATVTVHLEATVKGQIIRDAVQLFVTSYIRPDVVLSPGIVEFGSVSEGQPVVRELRLDYSGRPDWALTKIERGNPHVHAKAEEITRNYGEVSYKITVTLRPNTPVGYVKDALRFTTNERSVGVSKPSEIVLPIQGNVMASIHAKPSPFMVGLIAPGESVAKSFVVRSETPFRILAVETQDKRFRFSFAKQESNIQIVSVLFSSKDDMQTGPVDLNNKIRIRTNLPEQEFIVLDALARIAPKSGGTGQWNERQHPNEPMIVAGPIVEQTIPVEPDPGSDIVSASSRKTNETDFRETKFNEESDAVNNQAGSFESLLATIVEENKPQTLRQNSSGDSIQEPTAPMNAVENGKQAEKKARFGQPRPLR